MVTLAQTITDLLAKGAQQHQKMDYQRNNMAEENPVNGQITDAVTQANVTVLGQSPAQAVANFYQITAQSLGLSMQNSVASQQHMNTLNLSVVTQAADSIMGIESAVTARAVNEVLSDDNLAQSVEEMKAALDNLLLRKNTK